MQGHLKNKSKEIQKSNSTQKTEAKDVPNACKIQIRNRILRVVGCWSLMGYWRTKRTKLAKTNNFTTLLLIWVADLGCWSRSFDDPYPNASPIDNSRVGFRFSVILPHKTPTDTYFGNEREWVIVGHIGSNFFITDQAAFLTETRICVR